MRRLRILELFAAATVLLVILFLILRHRSPTEITATATAHLFLLAIHRRRQVLLNRLFSACFMAFDPSTIVASIEKATAAQAAAMLKKLNKTADQGINDRIDKLVLDAEPVVVDIAALLFLLVAQYKAPKP